MAIIGPENRAVMEERCLFGKRGQSGSLESGGEGKKTAQKGACKMGRQTERGLSIATKSFLSGQIKELRKLLVSVVRSQKLTRCGGYGENRGKQVIW